MRKEYSDELQRSPEEERKTGLASMKVSGVPNASSKMNRSIRDNRERDEQPRQTQCKDSTKFHNLCSFKKGETAYEIGQRTVKGPTNQ